ncbi:MAG: hypothetical protein ACRYFW_14545 [Janthinobacterium lividum]
MAALHRALGILLAGAALAGAAPDPIGRVEGLNLNSFVRDGPVSAHIVLRSGTDPRLIVAFPAGNSGVGLWFEPVPTAATWRLDAPARPVTLPDGKGRPLHGVTFTASIDTPRLVVKQAVLSSIRVLRDYQALGTAPTEVLTAPAAPMAWARDRLDGAPGYRLSIRAVRGTVSGSTIAAGADGRIAIEVTALTGETPLTPVPTDRLLTPTAAADPAAREALEFLSYREKYLAGSWRFDTYFGRDTLMSVRLLMPALQPAAVETGLASVLDRLSPDGQVAHEEDIGEFAILDHRRTDGSLSAAPVYDYKMVDGGFMLAPVARSWLLDDPRGRARAAAFLAQRLAGGDTNGARLVRNLRYVARMAAPFAAGPVAANLVALKPGVPVGQWRDSNDGLGGGRYAYDVNAVFVPAALDAASAFVRSGLLDRYLTRDDRAVLAPLAAAAAVWARTAPSLFEQSIAPARARAAIAAFAGKVGVPVPTVASPARFHALSLDADGRPVPVLNSDEGFALLFGSPSASDLADTADLIARPFPAGLMTGAGMLVANPVFASPDVQAKLGSGAYHGTVIWSWQQALAAAGLARQLARADLPSPVRAKLTGAQACVWHAIDATRAMRSSELWSWRYEDGRYRIAPYGAAGGDADESNAAQLWSTVFLALPHPATSGACPR